MSTQGVPLWSKTAATNSTADPAVNWAEGQAPSSVNDSARAMMASVAKFRDDLYGLTTSGTATAYAVTTNSTYATAVAMSGALFTIIPNATSGATPTLAVDGLTARALNASTGVAIPTGALISGSPYLVKYIHASTEFIVLGLIGKAFLAVLDIIGGTAETAIAVDDTLPLYDLSATANRRMLVSDFFKVINAFTADASPDRAADYVMTWDNSALAVKKVLLGNLPAKSPRGYIDGCIMANNASDASNDIDIAAGTCRDSTNTVDIICAAMTKQLDANWAAGTAAGFRNSAAGIANGTYHIYAVAKADGTQDYYAHTSVTVATVITALQAETGGTLYLYARRIGSILREGGQLVSFLQDGDSFMRKDIKDDIALNDPGTSAVLHTLSVPTGIKVYAEVDPFISIGTFGSTVHVLITDPAMSDDTPSSTRANLVTGQTSTSRSAGQFVIRTDTTRRIRSRQDGSGGAVNLYIATRGWRDTRGKDA